MKISTSNYIVICFVTICLILSSHVTNAQESKVQSKSNSKDSNLVVFVKAPKAVIKLVSTWDKDIWLYTSKTNPIKSISELGKWEDIAWSQKLFDHVLSFQEAIGIKETKTWKLGLADPIFTGRKNPPKLYITWSPKLFTDSDVAEANLSGGIRVKFVPEGK